MNGDLEGKTLFELHAIIVALKIKQYQKGLSPTEQERWVRAKSVREQRLEKLPLTKGVSDCNVSVKY